MRQGISQSDRAAAFKQWAATLHLIDRIKTIKKMSAGSALVLHSTFNDEIVTFSDFGLNDETVGGLIKLILLETYEHRLEEQRANLRRNYDALSSEFLAWAQMADAEDPHSKTAERLGATLYPLAAS